MKLVELLAKELAEWPENVVVYFQWGNGEVFATSKGFPTEYNDGMWYVVGSDIEMAYNAPMYDKKLDLADDHDTANVNRAQWQAERDRQKGGEWKRHRGGKRTVADDVVVEYKLRDGSKFSRLAGCLEWSHDNSEGDIMQYRVISQPQAEEAEMKGPFVAKAANQESTEIEVEDFINSGTWYEDQIDGPIKWRDTVNELDAYIEEFTREREALINRLALEGFALIPAMAPVMGVADVDMSDWRNWKAGDIVECTHSGFDKVYTEGKSYCVDHVTNEYAKVADDCGENSFCHINNDEDVKFRLVR